MEILADGMNFFFPNGNLSNKIPFTNSLVFLNVSPSFSHRQLTIIACQLVARVEWVAKPSVATIAIHTSIAQVRVTSIAQVRVTSIASTVVTSIAKSYVRVVPSKCRVSGHSRNLFLYPLLCRCRYNWHRVQGGDGVGVGQA